MKATLTLSLRCARASLATFCVFAMLASCKVRWIDSYNRESEESLLSTYGKVESLFDAMRQTVNDSSRRDYAKFADKYADIHQALQVQRLREDARPLNSESQGIVARIDTLFTKYRDDHRKRNTFDDVLLDRHRENMHRLFEAALKAERVKVDNPDGQ
jgi:hypothetical protein